MVLSETSPEVPEDWGRVLMEASTFEPGYKSPFDLDFKKLHEQYLDVCGDLSMLMARLILMSA